MGSLYSGGYLYSGGLDILVCYLYSGYLCCVGLSLFCWLYMFDVLSLLCWAICILVGCLYSGGPSVFWWAAYSLSLYSCGQSTEIVDYIFQLCPHFAQHTSKCLFY